MEIQTDGLGDIVKKYAGCGILYTEFIRECRKKFISEVLVRNKGNQCKAARELGMHRNTLSRTIAELKLDVRQLRAAPEKKRVQHVTSAGLSGALTG